MSDRCPLGYLFYELHKFFFLKYVSNGDDDSDDVIDGKGDGMIMHGDDDDDGDWDDNNGDRGMIK